MSTNTALWNDHYAREGVKMPKPPLVHIQAWIDGLKRGTRVLDVGCGHGRNAAALIEAGLIVHCCDVSETLVRGLPPVYRAIVASADNLSYYAAEVFDYVLCAGVVCYLPPERIAVAFSEMARVLVPGGILMCTTVAEDDPRSGKPTPDGMVWTFLSQKELCGYAEAAGFKVVNVGSWNITVDDVVIDRSRSVCAVKKGNTK